MQQSLGMFMNDRGLDAIAAEIGRINPGGPGYYMRRAIFVNYWRFGTQTFVFPHGRGFLRGGNGSGKSTVIGPLLPTIFDGVVRPERLDTKASVERRLIHYIQDKTGDRSAYVALEFAWEGDEKSRLMPGGSVKPPYMTIGFCLRAQSNDVKVLCFLLDKGDRLNIPGGIPLTVQRQDGKKGPRPAVEFRDLIKDKKLGTITENKDEYASTVAHEVFGFASRKPLDDLVKTMLILRNPDLGGGKISFTRVYEHLRSVLPPVSKEFAGAVAESFSTMTRLKNQVRAWREEIDALRTLRNADREYARAQGALLALPVREAEAADAAKQRELRGAETAAKEAAATFDRESKALQEEEARLERATGELKGLEETPLARDAQQVQNQIIQARQQVESAKLLLGRSEDSVKSVDLQIKTAGEDSAGKIRSWNGLKTKAAARLKELGSAARNALFKDGEERVEALVAELASCHVEEEEEPELPDVNGNLLPAIQGHMQRLVELLRLHDDYREAGVTEANDLRAWQGRQRDCQDATVEVETAQGRVERLWQQADEELTALDKEHLEIAAVAGGACGDVRAAVQLRDRQLLDESLAALSRCLSTEKERMLSRSSEIDRQLGRLQHMQREESKKLEERRREVDIEPERAVRRNEARKVLVGAGIEARPLYRLISYAEGLSDNRKGQVERMLEDSGLLDALLFKDGDAARASELLHGEGLSECWWSIPAPAKKAALGELLVVDPAIEEAEWKAAAERALRGISLEPDGTFTGVALRPDGGWSHGSLDGYAGHGDDRGFVGLANRQALRQRRIAELEALVAELDQQAGLLKSERKDLEDRRGAFTVEEGRILKAAKPREIDQARAAVEAARVHLCRAEEKLSEAAETLKASTERKDQVEAALTEAMGEFGAEGPDRDLVEKARVSLTQVSSGCEVVTGFTVQLRDVWMAFHDVQARLSRLRAHRIEALAAVEEARGRLEQAGNILKMYEEQAASGDIQKILDKITSLRERVEKLQKSIGPRQRSVGSAESVAQTTRARVEEAAAAAQVAATARATAESEFAGYLERNPDVLPKPEGSTLDQAHQLCPEGATQKTLSGQKDNREANREQLRSRVAVTVLKNYTIGISPEADGRLRVRQGGGRDASLDEEIEAIHEKSEHNKRLLTDEMERLYKDVFERQGYREIHNAIQASSEMIGQINGILEKTPLGKDHYWLSMDPRENADEENEDGSEGPAHRWQIAAYYKTFYRDPATLTDDERDKLREVFNRTLSDVYTVSQQPSAAPFKELLEKALDYRQWTVLSCHFRDPSGQEHTLDAQTVKRRSVGEQLFAVWIPLFTSLASVYDHLAASWAPRLLAMDEAFVNVSPDNIQKALYFLVDLRFQWLMASPVASGAGRIELPACADWTLSSKTEKGYAYATPFFYKRGRQIEITGADLRAQEV